MADEQDQIRRTLDEHWFYDDTDTCECGYWAHFDSVRRHHIEDELVAALHTSSQQSAEDWVLALVEGDAALIRTARNDALRRAADVLEAQPPKLKAQYVATLRLYADEPERLGLVATPPGCTCSRGTESNVVCPVHVGSPAVTSWHCRECGHCHAPDGCTGDPTPSDLWAGVTPAACDCDVVIPPGLPAQPSPPAPEGGAS